MWKLILPNIKSSLWTMSFQMYFLLKVLLNNEKFQIVTAGNGTEALAQVKKEKPDLVLLDVMMPDISGFDVAKQMKADPEMSDIPIIS